MALVRVDQAQIKGKKVLVRFDFNVPLDKNDPSKILDTTRIDYALPTLNYLIENQASKIILMSHLGRPKGKVNTKYSLEPVASYLAEKLGKEILLTETCLDEGIPTLINLPKTLLVMLENLSFHSEEEGNDKDFAERLASYADLYVNDAFGVSHRKHASVYQIVSFFPKKAYAGFLLNQEVSILENMMNKPKKPFVALLGGAKVADKIKTISKLLVIVDKLLIGGAMAYPFLKAQGHNVGTSLCSNDDVELAKSILRQDGLKKIHLPVDHICATSIDSELTKNCDNEIVDNFMGLDIGPKTILKYEAILSEAKTIFWNGPMGIFEKKQFASGTLAMCKHLAQCKQALTIIGGGDSVSAVQQSGYADQMGHISTGGGASLEFIEKGELPGVHVLKFGLS